MTGHKTWAQLKRYTNIKPADVHAAVTSGGKVHALDGVRRKAAQRARSDASNASNATGL